MRMAIEPRRFSVGGPASVGNASMGVEGLSQIRLGLFNELLKLSYLSHLLKCEDLILLIAINSQTRRVIATVFKSRES